MSSKEKKNDGGPAFPRAAFGAPETGMLNHEQDGMSLRDYFAGQALAGLLANPDVNGEVHHFATDAYRCADAMLAERSREK